MARPSKFEQDEENFLMLIHDYLDQSICLDGEAAAILRQIENRWPEAHNFLLRVDEILRRNLNICDAAQELVQQRLDAGQLKRSITNRKRPKN
jgi:hypothetical protein